MTDKLEIMRVLVLSTAHLTEAEGQVPATEWPCTCYENDEYGFFVCVADLEILLDKEWKRDDWHGLLACAQFAREHKLDWVRFDCDADTVDGLATYDW